MDTCDNCGNEAELYHNEASGLAYCEDCDTAADERDAAAFRRMDERLLAEAEGTFHAELRRVIEQVEGTDLEALVPHAVALLALPEASVAALAAAAQSMVGAASFGR